MRKTNLQDVPHPQEDYSVRWNRVKEMVSRPLTVAPHSRDKSNPLPPKSPLTFSRPLR